jgi:hypothetical protein
MQTRKEGNKDALGGKGTGKRKNKRQERKGGMV